MLSDCFYMERITVIRLFLYGVHHYVIKLFLYGVHHYVIRLFLYGAYHCYQIVFDIVQDVPQPAGYFVSGPPLTNVSLRIRLR